MNIEDQNPSQPDKEEKPNPFDDFFEIKTTSNHSANADDLEEFFKCIDSIEAGFSVTSETPAPVKRALAANVDVVTDAEIIADLDRALVVPNPEHDARDELESILDDINIPADELEALKASGEVEVADLPGAAAAVQANSRMPPELKALIHHRANELKEENYRNGRKARAHKKEQREAYAADILEREGRAVRAYTHHTTPEAAEEARKLSTKLSNQKRQAKMTPEEKKAKNLHDAERRRQRKAEAKAKGEAAMKALPDFGII